MAKVAPKKSSLTKEREKLKLSRRVLPSLELKRQQLMGQRAKSRLEVKQERADLKSFYEGLSEQLPRLADDEIEVSGLVKITKIELGEDNVVGVKLPVLKKLETEVAEYSFLGKPQWVDVLVERLHHAAEMWLEIRVAEERARRMEVAVRRITRRVNLFEKIMIPDARRNIKRIQSFLGDADRSAVVRSKIAKAKRLKARESMNEGEFA
jgi:V/A-type H+-transporting ATPase subunit D